MITASSGDVGTAAPGRPGRAKLGYITAAILCAALIAVFAIFLFIRSRGAFLPAAKAPMTERQLTRNPPENRTFGAAISPDGKIIAFTDTLGLHLSSVDSADVHDLALPEHICHKAMGIMWFPDGHNLLLTLTPLVKALRFGWSPLSETSPVRCGTEVTDRRFRLKPP